MRWRFVARARTRERFRAPGRPKAAAHVALRADRKQKQVADLPVVHDMLFEDTLGRVSSDGTELTAGEPGASCPGRGQERGRALAIVDPHLELGLISSVGTPDSARSSGFLNDVRSHLPLPVRLCAGCRG